MALFENQNKFTTAILISIPAINASCIMLSEVEPHVKSAITFPKVATLMTIQVVLSMEVKREKNQQFCGSRKIEEEQSWRCGVETEARTMG